jgi:hypothetical protein
MKQHVTAPNHLYRELLWQFSHTFPRVKHPEGPLQEKVCQTQHVGHRPNRERDAQRNQRASTQGDGLSLEKGSVVEHAGSRS